MNDHQSLSLGEMQTLEMVKQCDFGVYLSTSSQNESNKVLLPKAQVPSTLKLGDKIQVFLYKDSEDRLIATTLEPKLQLGEIAILKVKQVGKIGAFLDWGLSKDLLLPFKEQTKQVKENEDVLVALYIDKSSRLCATMNVYEYLKRDSPYQKEDMVTGTVYETSNEFGAFVAVDNMYSGLIPQKELFAPLLPGEKIEARVTAVKEDGKLDLSLRQKSYIQMDYDSKLILDKLQENNGYLPYHDKSNAEEIKSFFQLSKNAFKRAVGRLLKENKIEFYDNGIRLK